jgi:hypothetical protein
MAVCQSQRQDGVRKSRLYFNLRDVFDADAYAWQQAGAFLHPANVALLTARLLIQPIQCAVAIVGVNAYACVWRYLYAFQGCLAFARVAGDASTAFAFAAARLGYAGAEAFCALALITRLATLCGVAHYATVRVLAGA